MGSAMPDALETAPLLLHHARPREDNCRSHHNVSLVEPTGHVADASRAAPHDVSGNHYDDHKVQATGRYTVTFRPVAAWDHTPKRFKFQGARHRLAAAEQPRAGSDLEPVRPETAGKILRDLTIRTMTSKPDEGSWDFDGCESTSVRNRTRQSPIVTHETLPVPGASVMGMTIWVGQGQYSLSADVPGITTALGQRGRLQSKGRLRQQPAGDFTVGSPSRRR
jgi:hypothetical protein